jgi:lipopolysaccharide transport protein LptA
MMRIFIFFSLVIFNVSSVADKKDNILIDSNYLDFDLVAKTGVYYDEVVVRSGNYRLECDRMEVFLNSSDDNKIDQSYSVKRILFYDNIVLSSGKRVINAKRGEYLANKRIIYFWDTVSIKDGGNYIESDKITYDLNKDIIKVSNEAKNDIDKDGKRVRIILDDKNEPTKSN